MSVSRAQREISSREFAYWVAWWRHSALDTEGWEQTAMICSTVAASVGAKDVKNSDFMPIIKRPQSLADMSAVMEAFCG